VIHYKYERKYKHAQGLFKEHTNSEYHTAISNDMTQLGKQKDTIFLGQNVICGDFCGTLKGVPIEKRIEFPVAEELQMGMSIGLSLGGFVPISCYPRMDFLPRAFDQIINHLNLIEKLSEGIFKPKVIIRTTKGLQKAGLQHNKDLYGLLKKTCAFPVSFYDRFGYWDAYGFYSSTLTIEEQEKYG
jgi:pyruvate/2-oxoglutarate/acetoin dehydrogenase E1 component